MAFGSSTFGSTVYGGSLQITISTYILRSTVEVGDVYTSTVEVGDVYTSTVEFIY